jgi:hypothetical protein
VCAYVGQSAQKQQAASRPKGSRVLKPIGPFDITSSKNSDPFDAGKAVLMRLLDADGSPRYKGALCIVKDSHNHFSDAVL